MSLFDQLAGGFNKVTKDLSGKAQELTDTVKLNSKVNDANALVKSTFTAIGQAYYEKHKDDTDNEFADQFRIIDEANASIEEYKNEIARLKGMVRCSVCGAEVTKGASFCQKCGSKIVVVEPKEETPKSEEKHFCTNCGNELEEDALFCVNCGTPVGETKDAKEEAPAEPVAEDAVEETVESAAENEE